MKDALFVFNQLLSRQNAGFALLNNYIDFFN